MKFSKKHLITAIMLTVSTLSFGQSTTASSEDPKQDIAINYTGNFTTHSTGNDIDLRPSSTGGFSAAYRYSFRPNQAVELSYGLFKSNQKYTDGADAEFRSRVHQWSAAYVLQSKSGSFKPFALAGAGVLVFSPLGTAADDYDVARQTKAAFVYGLGADYSLSSNVALRAQYRGYVYKAPDFGSSDLTTNATGHLAQPSVGLVIRF